MKTIVDGLFVLALLAPPLVVAVMLLVLAFGRPRHRVGRVPNAHAA
jgi:ABC-type molybdate transport system permease subunit